MTNGACGDGLPLSQRKPDTTIEVDLDISELEVSSAETKATYEEIKSYVLKNSG